MYLMNDPMPGCVPEYYREQQEERDRQYDLAMQRKAHYLANRQKLGDGNRRRSAEIVADSVNFGDSRPQSRPEQQAYAPATAGVAHGGGYAGDDTAAGDDLPF